jgi:hypothetical protein
MARVDGVVDLLDSEALVVVAIMRPCPHGLDTSVSGLSVVLEERCRGSATRPGFAGLVPPAGLEPAPYRLEGGSSIR